MGKLIDISAKITNELPTVKITDELVVTVNNRKSTILNVQAMINQLEKKASENEDEFDKMKFMNKILEMLLGPKKTKEIDDLDLPFPEYQLIYETMMSVATGSDEDTPS